MKKTIQILSAVAIMTAGTAWAQDTDQGMSSCPHPWADKGKGMLEWHKKSLEKFKEQNAELDKLVQEMNNAPADKKVDAMAAVINKALEQRKGWQTDMESRQEKIKEWMKEKREKAGEALEHKE